MSFRQVIRVAIVFFIPLIFPASAYSFETQDELVGTWHVFVNGDYGKYTFPLQLDLTDDGLIEGHLPGQEGVDWWKDRGWSVLSVTVNLEDSKIAVVIHDPSKCGKDGREIDLKATWNSKKQYFKGSLSGPSSHNCRTRRFKEIITKMARVD